jgi:S1-C subfamily serine protease
VFRRWIQIVGVAFTILALLSVNAPAVAAQAGISNTPVPVRDSATEEVGGATIQNINPAIARELGFPPITPGIVVMDVNPSSPAGAAGLLPGDVIVAVNNTPVQTTSQLKDTIWWMGVTPVMFSVVRGGADYIFTFPVW